MTASHPERQAESLISLISRMRQADRDGDHRVSIDDMVTELGDRAFGPLLFLLGAIQMLPTGLLPGVTPAVGLLTALTAAQLLASLRLPVIPRRLGAVSIAREQLDSALVRLERWAGWADRHLRPRLGLLVTPLPARALIALGCILCGVLIIVAGFVPGAAVVPALAVCSYGIGVLFGDGLAIAAGHTIALGSAGLIALLVSLL